MRRTLQLLVVTFTALVIVSAATPADAKKKWWHSGGPSRHWASTQVSFTGSCVSPGPLVLGTLPGKFRLTDVVIGNPGTLATVHIQETVMAGTPPVPTPTTRLSLVVPTGTLSDSFRVPLVLMPGDLQVLCDINVYITLSGKLEELSGHQDDDDDDDDDDDE
jgi:hypothetical protein